MPKYDGSAAILGAVVGAFCAYLSLATVGSGATDLTDLTALAAWVLLLLGSVVWSLEVRNAFLFLVWVPVAVWVRPIAALLLGAKT